MKAGSSDRMIREPVINALDNAYKYAAKPKGVLTRSDRGSHYCSYSYQAYLKSRGLICSMSRKGDCWDNAPMEAFCRWATISHGEGPQGIDSCFSPMPLAHQPNSLPVKGRRQVLPQTELRTP